MTQSTAAQKAAYVLKQFNWRAVLVRVLVNALTLMITVFLVPSISFVDPSLWKILALGVVLGLLNAFIKPIIQFLTLSYIFATFGLVIIFINAVILFLISLLFPDLFQVGGVVWALVGGLVMGVVGGFLESLFGLTLPIVDENAMTEEMKRAAQLERQRQRAFRRREEAELGIEQPPEPAAGFMESAQSASRVAGAPAAASEPAPTAKKEAADDATRSSSAETNAGAGASGEESETANSDAKSKADVNQGGAA